MSSLQDGREPANHNSPSLSIHYDFLTEFLPPEITSEIFQWATNASSDKLTTVASISSVSQRWRELALSTPQLWTTISVRLGWTSSELFSEWIRRSGKLPLAISVTCSPSTKRPKPEMQRHFDLLKDCSDRWEELRLSLPAHLLPYVAAKPHTCLLLRLLDIHLTDARLIRRPPIFNFQHVIPSPSLLFTTGFKFSSIGINWSNLTGLTADMFSVDQVLECLRQSPQLVQGTFSLTPGTQHEFTIPPDRLFHPKLTYLKLSLNSLVGSMNELFDHLSLSSLTFLWCKCTNEASAQCLKNMLTHSSSPGLELLSLNLSTNFPSERSLIDLLRSLPKLESLSVQNGSLSDAFFQLLASTVIMPDDSSESFLPYLKDITIIGPKTYSYAAVAEIFAPATEGLPVRYRRRPLTQLCLSFNDFETNYPAPHLIGKELALRLLQLEKAGIEIDIGSEFGDGSDADFLETAITTYNLE